MMDDAAAGQQWKRYLTIEQHGGEPVPVQHHVANGVYLKPGRYEVTLENYDKDTASAYRKRLEPNEAEVWYTWLYFLARSVEGSPWRLEFDILAPVANTAPLAQDNFNRLDAKRRQFELPIDAQIIFNASFDRQKDVGRMCVVFTRF